MPTESLQRKVRPHPTESILIMRALLPDTQTLLHSLLKYQIFAKSTDNTPVEYEKNDEKVTLKNEKNQEKKPEKKQPVKVQRNN